jgi:hypothetical protein
MRLLRNNECDTIKEADTAEEYLLLEIERLKEENARLKKELEAEKENKIVRFVIGFNAQKETEYKVKLNGKKISVEALEENKNE